MLVVYHEAEDSLLSLHSIAEEIPDQVEREAQWDLRSLEALPFSSNS